MFKKIFFSICLVSSLAFSLELPQNKLVDVKWLKGNLNDKDLVIIDIREDDKLYKKSHIPNAIQWKVGDFRETRFGMPGFIASPTAFERLAKKSGISEKSTIVFYSDGKEAVSYTIATLGVFVSEYYGITNTAILNGGFAAWKKEGFEVSDKKTKVKKTDFEVVKFNKDIVATSLDMDEAVELKNANLIDGRNDEQFSGTKKHPKVEKFGHIPEALHVFIANFTKEDGGIFYIKSDKKAVDEVLKASKMNLSKPTIWYCNSGWFASGGWFATKYIAGIKNVKDYEGSMIEYSNLPKRKMVK